MRLVLVGAFRAIVLAAVSAFIVWNPIDWRWRSPAHRNPFAYDWRMFHSYGAGVCRVRYTLEDGRRTEPLDRYALLGYASPDASPPWLRRIYLHRGKDAARSLDDVTRMICRRLGERAGALRLTADCSGEDAWVAIYGGRSPICPYLDERRGR
jgi:hypothetical protein